jgi:hypothetical protein
VRIVSNVDKDTESRSVDAVFDVVRELSGDQQKLVDVGADDWVDVALVDLLAATQDSEEADAPEDSVAMLNDLALLDL